MKTRIPYKTLAACLVATALALTGCSSGNGGEGSQPATPGTTSGSAQAPAQATASGTIKLAYVEWDSCVAATNVAAATLEKAGYTVRTVSVTGAMMYEGLANGDVDAIVCAWLPTTHADYYAKTKDRLVNLGSNMKSARLGLAVPDYVKINSITDLANPDTARKFKNRIVGIDPGAGIMRLTGDVIKHYKLPEKLVEGSDATMTAVLKDSIRKHQPVVVTSWKPHWMWAKWKLKFLDDPDNVYGKPDNIDTLVRKGLKTDMPKAYAILAAFHFSSDDRGEVMAADRENGADPKADAKQWVDSHPDQVDKWMGVSGDTSPAPAKASSASM
jgi:glycine betaine/proline transport system substrate-binding protein